MGNSNSQMPPANWLITNNQYDIQIFDKIHYNKLEEEYRKYQKEKKWKLFAINYKNVNKVDDKSKSIGIRSKPWLDSGSWEYYRDIASKATNKPQISNIPQYKYFIFAQYYNNTDNIISNKLRLSLLSNLSKLSLDDTIKYDLRDANNGRYLYYKTHQFGIPNITNVFQNNKWINYDLNDLNDVPISQSTSISNNNQFIEPKYLKNQDCIIYTNKNKVNNSDNSDNTGFIHDLIDPNKNLNENKLWIPTIFDCKYVIKDINNFDINKIIKSPILNLDYVKYKSLYNDIGLIFKCCVQQMFENILNYKLSSNEKIIVKSMKYILQKPGDWYKGNVHREGMGENIVAVCVYYPQVSSKENGMKNGELKIQIPEVCNSFLKCHQIQIKEGSCVTFSNEGYHQLPIIEYGSPKVQSLINPISRTILVFFLINKYNSDNILATNETSLNCNLIYYWIYYISYWIRKYNFDDDNINFKWMNNIIFNYLFESNHNDYVYYRRHKMRKEKAKPLHSPIKLSNRLYRQCEEMIMNFDGRLVM